MANEIKAYNVSGLTLYAVIRNGTGQAWDTAGEAFEAFNAMGDYDIALTDKSGSMYVGDFPSTASAGYYTIQIFTQAGGSPADNDLCILVEDGYWDETTWYKNITQLQTIRAKTDLIPASPAAVGSAMTLATNAVSAAALATDAVTEIWAAAMSDMAAGAPSATCSVLTAINYLYETWRNKKTVSSSELTLYKDDGSTGLCKASVSDSGTLYTKGEFGAV